MEKRFPYLQDFFIQHTVENVALADKVMLKEFIESSAAMEGSASFFWLMDYTKRTPEYVSGSVKQVLGYHSSFLKSSSMETYLRLVPAEDRSILKKVFANISAFYQQIPVEEKSLYRFDFNYRVQRSDQRFISVMQQTMYVQSSCTGSPLLELSLFTDFSTYKNNPQVQLQIYKLEKESYIRIATYHYDEYLEKLTEREQEVITLIAQGLIDKEIADKICVSLHTVKTHRKHILQKMNSRNTAEAVNKYLTGSGPLGDQPRNSGGILFKRS